MYHLLVAIAAVQLAGCAYQSSLPSTFNSPLQAQRETASPARYYFANIEKTRQAVARSISNLGWKIETESLLQSPNMIRARISPEGLPPQQVSIALSKKSESNTEVLLSFASNEWPLAQQRDQDRLFHTQLADALSADITRTRDEIEAQRLPREQNNFLPCRDGPGALRKIDDIERSGNVALTKNKQGQQISAESYAEMLIDDCSQGVAYFTSAQEVMKDNPLIGATASLWRENLNYLKWWLLNRRQKQQLR